MHVRELILIYLNRCKEKEKYTNVNDPDVLYMHMTTIKNIDYGDYSDRFFDFWLTELKKCWQKLTDISMKEKAKETVRTRAEQKKMLPINPDITAQDLDVIFDSD